MHVNRDLKTGVCGLSTRQQEGSDPQGGYAEDNLPPRAVVRAQAAPEERLTSACQTLAVDLEDLHAA